MNLPTPQAEAILRHKQGDREARHPQLPALVLSLIENEKKLNDLFWSLFDRGVCSDKVLADYFMHERNAVRVRIRILQRRYARENHGANG